MEKGVFNNSADGVDRENETWSDTNLSGNFKCYIERGNKFKRLKCRNCGGIYFEVLGTDMYETTAQCIECRMYYIVHCG